ncbi:MAG TPA: hypothetical protein VJL31_10820, partial [Gemmatimonadales bacterium]|nr:hypothetical protein [Gemmatimonadales bacterium]
MSSPRRLAARRFVVIPFAALLALACEHNAPTSPSVLTTITVTPNPQSLAISAKQPFAATGRDADSNLVA